MKSWAQNQRGFTIVELLIVIVVIAVLAAVGLVAYNGVQQRARDTKRAADIDNVKDMLEIYKAQTGTYPAVCPGGDNAGCSLSLLSTPLVPSYMPAIPSDPGSSTYHYVKGTGTESYAIYIQGYEARPACKTGVNVNAGWWGAGVSTC